MILIQPEHGDRPMDYRTIVATNPLTGAPAQFIPLTADKACIYLGDIGCTIWAKRPAICRAYSCVDDVLNTPRHVRRQRVRDGQADPKLYERGKELLRAHGETNDQS